MILINIPNEVQDSGIKECTLASNDIVRCSRVKHPIIRKKVERGECPIIIFKHNDYCDNKPYRVAMYQRNMLRQSKLITESPKKNPLNRV